jgi:hypothetical protein
VREKVIKTSGEVLIDFLSPPAFRGNVVPRTMFRGTHAYVSQRMPSPIPLSQKPTEPGHVIMRKAARTAPIFALKETKFPANRYVDSERRRR